RKAHPKPWQMTTRDGLGEVSDHSRSMAMTAGSTLSATAGPPAISNATSTIAKRRTRISPDETPRRIYKAADSSPRCTRPQVLGPRHFVGKRDLFDSPPTHMRRQRIDDGSDSVFWGRPDAVVVLITSEMGHKQTSCRPRSPAMSAHLAFVDARGGCGVVLVVTPRRMMEMDDEIAIVWNGRLVEGDGSDAAPIAEGAPLAEERAVRLPVIGNLDVERERALRPGVAAVVDLRHDLV